MKKKVEMVMLPALGTDWTVFKNVHLGDRVFTLDMELGGAMNALNYRGQHLYATVSQDVEAIKEGDWAMYLEQATKDKPSKNAEPYLVTSIEEVHWNDRKIIATTDPKLNSYVDGNNPLMGEFIAVQFPQLSLSSIKEYVSNPDGLFEVEYEEEYVDGYTEDRVRRFYGDCKLKLNQDSEVESTSVEKLPILVQQDMSCTLGVGEGGGQMYVHGNYKSIKHLQGKLLNLEKTYSKEDVESILYQYAEDEHGWFSSKSEIESFNNWIEENL